MTPHLAAAPPVSVRVRAPGKVNLSLRVGARQDDGYHPLVTIFQAVSLVEEVHAQQVPDGSGISVSVTGTHAERVPTDSSNIVWQAAEALARYAGVAPDVHLDIVKGVPVAGGMAGGSADGAAALLACDALWETGVGRAELMDLAAGLGADVPFGLVGHTAVGTGRGHLLTPAMARGEFHWVFAVRDEGLPTVEVFRVFDDVVGGTPDVELADDTELMQALRAGDAVGLGRALHNDLQRATLEMMPDLARTMSVARDSGALGVIVSGSGPTIAALARSRQHALAIAASWTAADVADAVYCATGPTPGARVVQH
ncbi:4-(cytidine 5'-diphospho)-2-C-methyl-D-erythritol kinase [Oerskovia flava]|uniref:4-(cytidine 5'-diphospho)-2-C-methyl-D-erythritol kinase n=1 Tax=Oerskovia flava TaxID=2986422 RepID=UPI00223EB45C|nr:4-(cytidine 5'-diphospho)-2-C-methyl-D-erythritol kinase [Oerskovia sp. JB1-3-2]